MSVNSFGVVLGNVQIEWWPYSGEAKAVARAYVETEFQGRQRDGVYAFVRAGQWFNVSGKQYRTEQRKCSLVRVISPAGVEIWNSAVEPSGAASDPG